MRSVIVIFFAIALLVGFTTVSGKQNRDTNYFAILPIFWSKLYPAGGETLYCAKRFGSQKGKDINVEHVFPMSWVLRELGCYDRGQCRRDNKLFRKIEADMHNLFPARRDINHARGHMAFGIVTGEKRVFGSCDFEIDKRARRVEPRKQSRGEIARAMLYMHDTYKLKIFRRSGILLKKWNLIDPPNDVEQQRNDIIEKLQGNRNRFIDNPKHAEALRF